MKASVVALFLVVSVGLADAVLPVDKRERQPWFCKNRDCPSFKTVREEAEYSLRRYDRTTWAISCAYDAYMPDSVLRATAKVLNYVKENDLWGATPLASVVHMSFDNQEAWTAWNATTSEEAVLSGQAKLPEGGDLGLGWAHRTICAAYFLPDKYQADLPRNEVDRRPPRPGRKSGVKIVRIRGFEAFVSGFHGFPTPPRFVWESMRLVHSLKWHREEFNWGTAAFFVYNGPAEVEGRWNEVLIPKRRSHDELFAKMAEEDAEE